MKTALKPVQDRHDESGVFPKFDLNKDGIMMPISAFTVAEFKKIGITDQRIMAEITGVLGESETLTRIEIVECINVPLPIMACIFGAKPAMFTEHPARTSEFEANLISIETNYSWLVGIADLPKKANPNINPLVLINKSEDIQKLLDSKDEQESQEPIRLPKLKTLTCTELLRVFHSAGYTSQTVKNGHWTVSDGNGRRAIIAEKHGASRHGSGDFGTSLIGEICHQARLSTKDFRLAMYREGITD